MTYMKLGSLEAAEALQRALEIKSVARAAKGLLKVDDVLGMVETEALMAFQFVRFADSRGMPTCPRCSEKNRVEHIRKRPRFRCRSCKHDFTLTSSTMLHGRKMGMRSYLSLLSLLLDKGQFRSLLHFSKETGMDYKTAFIQTRRLRLATTDDKGCTVPFSLLTREAWQIRQKGMERYIAPFMPATKEAVYPYLRQSNKHENGADLLAFVNTLVPRQLPEYLRADICQDMILAVLTGETTRDALKADHRAFLTKVFSQYPWKYKWISFDQPLGNEEGGGTLHDIVSEEQAHDALLYGR